MPLEQWLQPVVSPLNAVGGTSYAIELEITWHSWQWVPPAAAVIAFGNSLDKLRHTRSVAYLVELVLLNKHQISGGGADLLCRARWRDLATVLRFGDAMRTSLSSVAATWACEELDVAFMSQTSSLSSFRQRLYGNSPDKLRHPRADAYSAEQVLLNSE